MCKAHKRVVRPYVAGRKKPHHWFFATLNDLEVMRTQETGEGLYDGFFRRKAGRDEPSRIGAMLECPKFARPQKIFRETMQKTDVDNSRKLHDIGSCADDLHCRISTLTQLSGMMSRVSIVGTLNHGSGAMTTLPLFGESHAAHHEKLLSGIMKCLHKLMS